jgi:Cu-Zn family superoxide dismutase
MRKKLLTMALLAGCAAFAAEKDKNDKKMSARMTQPAATAMMKDASGKDVGRVDFYAAGKGVLLKATLDGLPSGEHAIHIHETGKCDAPDFESAGDHFNPTGASHGYLSGKSHHAGDMPNFNASGSERFEIFNESVTLDEGSKTSLFKSGGTAVVVHSDPDDYTSQPSGDAGSRIACGVVERGSAKTSD